MTPNLDRAVAAWGPELPEWIKVLAASSDQSDQRQTAYRIGYSPPVVNQVLNRSYKGNLKRVQTAVEGALMAVTVDCPVVGELAANICLKYQDRPFAATNPERVKLYRACRSGCRHSRIGKTTEEEGSGA